jgi:hypothetical protein
MLVLTPPPPSLPLIRRFEGLSINVPNTLVTLKVTVPGFTETLTASFPNPMKINSNTPSDPIATFVALGEMPDAYGPTATLDSTLNQYVVDALVLQENDEDQVVVEGEETNEIHNNFDGDFVVSDWYDDAACASYMHTTFEKYGDCIAQPKSAGGNMRSTKVIDFTPPRLAGQMVEMIYETYLNTSTCQNIYNTNIGGGNAYTFTETEITTLANKQTTTDNVDVCFQDPTTGLYKKHKRLQTSISDGSVCAPSKQAVRVSEWKGGTGGLLCHSLQKQPLVTIYPMETCMKIPGEPRSFKFNTCHHQHAAVLTEYDDPLCEGQGSQRVWGSPKADDACFVGMEQGWGVGGAGVDFAVECGHTCT